MVEPGGGVSPGPADLLTAMQMAVLSVAPDGRIDRVNPAAEALLNTSAQHLRGRMLGDMLTLPRNFEPEGEGPFAAFEVAVSTVRGQQLLVDLEIARLPDHPGWRMVAIRSSGIAHKVGHRLDRGGNMRTAIGAAAMLAHEIRNPLSGIRGAAQLVESRLGDDDKRMMRLIRTEVDRIAGLVEQMQDFTDPRPAQMTAENVHQIIDHARGVAQNGFGQALLISDSFDPSLPMVLANRDSLIQVLINLMKNAAETAIDGKPRKLRISTAYRHGMSLRRASDGQKIALPIEVCVIDDGPGVPADIADDLFQPFVSSKPSGRGLGLALADKLVRDMGGVIQYAREGRPAETVFRLLLQRAGGRRQ